MLLRIVIFHVHPVVGFQFYCICLFRLKMKMKRKWIYSCWTTVNMALALRAQTRTKVISRVHCKPNNTKVEVIYRSLLQTRPELWRRMDPAPALASSESESPVSSQSPCLRRPRSTSDVVSPATWYLLLFRNNPITWGAFKGHSTMNYVCPIPQGNNVCAAPYNYQNGRLWLWPYTVMVWIIVTLSQVTD